MKRFVIGDIHGAHRALVQCLERSEFNRQEDLLICLGDLCDGWPDVEEVLNELSELRNLVLIRGNHDQWMMDWFNTGEAPYIWLKQGGRSTINSFAHGVAPVHRQLLNDAVLYHVLDNTLFVHGGYLCHLPITGQDMDNLMWDRSLVTLAMENKELGKEVKITQYDTVYVGHTPTINYGTTKPITTCGICLMDTGAGWPGGVLTMKDIDSKTVFQSEPSDQLYPEFCGRM